MKSTVIICSLLYTCAPQPTTSPPVEAVTPVAQVATVPLEFEKDIQPILQSHCTPCHFKDGKMYQRMPFDQSKTLVDFQEGILRRLKNEEEVAKIKMYLAGLK